MRTFNYCEVMFCTKCGSQIENEYNFCSKLTDSVLLQLQNSICEEDIIWNYFQAGYPEAAIQRCF